MEKRFWTPEEVNLLTEKYPNTTAQDLAVVFDRPESQIYNKAQALRLRKDKEFKAELGRRYTQHPRAVEHRFKPGSTPPNKGKKMPPELYERVKKTMFKKGHRPANYKPVGSERVNVDGYIEIKVAEPRTWKLKHRIIWEEANGPIPPGCNIQFKNKNPLDVRIENLYIISRGDQMKNENSMIARYPEDLRKVIRLKGAINRKLTMLTRNNNE